MKALELFFKQKGLSPYFGIAYNLKGLQEVKFWDQEGEIYVIKEVPLDLDEGIHTFKVENDQITKVRK